MGRSARAKGVRTAVIAAASRPSRKKNKEGKARDPRLWVVGLFKIVSSLGEYKNIFVFFSGDYFLRYNPLNF